MSLYTVEQIELIRRLRLTGISAAQIIEAFQIFDRLDQELGVQTRSDLSQVTSALLPHMLAQANAFMTSSPSSFNCSDVLVQHGNNSKANYPVSGIFGQRASASPAINGLLGSNMPVDSMPTMIDCYGAGSALWPPPTSTDSTDCPRRSPSNKGKVSRSSESNSEQKPVNSVRLSLERLGPMDPEVKKEIDELMEREEAAILEMRDYVTSHQLRQQAIAHMCGISQPYVSKFLNGSYRDLSERVRRLIFHWYVKSKRESTDYGHVMVNAGEPAQLKRERFIFKRVHTNLLEKYFQQDQYPNMAKREEICTALNEAFRKHHKGRDLDEKEVVSEHVVGTWFSNKRKDKKRKDFREIKTHPNSGNQKSLLNQFLDNIRQSSNPESDDQVEPAITVDDSLNDDFDEYEEKGLDKEDEIMATSADEECKVEEDTVLDDVALKPFADGSYSDGVMQNQLDAVNNSVYALLHPY